MNFRNEFGRVTVFVTEPCAMYPEGKVEISAPSFTGKIPQANLFIEDIARACIFAESVRFDREIGPHTEMKCTECDWKGAANSTTIVNDRIESPGNCPLCDSKVEVAP
jgi:hypothetical protein